MDPLSDEKIVDSWDKNAEPWIAAVREEQIASRALCTDQAIIEAVLDGEPQTVLDVGCGEGWLTRALCARGLQVTGIDVVPALIEEARRAGGGTFHLLSYEDLAGGKWEGRVDAVVCNFSLLGKESVEGILRAASGLLNPQGRFIVQTLHPVWARGDVPYRDGWRKGSWDGFGDDFTDPAPWYFRTLASWIRLFLANDFQLIDLREPIHPKHEKPASVIFIAERREDISRSL